MEKKLIDYSDFKKQYQIQVDMKINAEYFVKKMVEICPVEYRGIFKTPIKRIAFSHVQPYNIDKVMIVYDDSLDNAYTETIVVDAITFCSDIDKCIDDYVSAQIEIEKKRIEREELMKQVKKELLEKEEYELYCSLKNKFENR